MQELKTVQNSSVVSAAATGQLNSLMWPDCPLYRSPFSEHATPSLLSSSSFLPRSNSRQRAASFDSFRVFFSFEAPLPDLHFSSSWTLGGRVCPAAVSGVSRCRENPKPGFVRLEPLPLLGSQLQLVTRYRCTLQNIRRPLSGIRC